METRNHSLRTSKFAVAFLLPLSTPTPPLPPTSVLSWGRLFSPIWSVQSSCPPSGQSSPAAPHLLSGIQLPPLLLCVTPAAHHLLCGIQLPTMFSVQSSCPPSGLLAACGEPQDLPGLREHCPPCMALLQGCASCWSLPYPCVTPHACRGKHLTWVNILQYGLGVVAAITIFILGWIYAKKAMALIEARARERAGKRDDGVVPTASDAARQVGLHPAKGCCECEALSVAQQQAGLCCLQVLLCFEGLHAPRS